VYKLHLKDVSIVLFLGHNVNEYRVNTSEEIIQQLISSGTLCCEICLKSMKRHSNYTRKIKGTGQEITIIIIWCRKCRIWHALLPDFLLPNKHYSGNEIESVIIDSASVPVNQIETEASESTVRRWINQIGDSITGAIGRLKYIFKQAGQAVSEAAIDAGHVYNELEQLLEIAPYTIKYSGNKLGLVNLWLGVTNIKVYI